MSLRTKPTSNLKYFKNSLDMVISLKHNPDLLATEIHNLKQRGDSYKEEIEQLKTTHQKEIEELKAKYAPSDDSELSDDD